MNRFVCLLLARSELEGGTWAPKHFLFGLPSSYLIRRQ